ncbi:MAG: phage tail assembly chaperone [Pseudomonadota bacterium]
MSERFGPRAAALSGQAALLLGWLPDTFWAATPEELASVLSAMRVPDSGTIDKGTLDRLMEADRGG